MTIQGNSKCSILEATVLQEISQGRSRLRELDFDSLTLLRLADEPVLLNAFLRASALRRVSPSPGRDCDLARAVYPVQMIVSGKDSSGFRSVRAYSFMEGEASESVHPAPFSPSWFDRDAALDGLAGIAHEVSVVPHPQRRAGFWSFSLCLAALALVVLFFIASN